MATRIETLTRPHAGETYRSPSKHRTIGLVLAVVGMMLAVVTLIANIAAAGSEDAAQILAWSFGLTTTAFAVVKVAIGIILIGILVRLWMRVDGVKSALTQLKGPGDGGGTKSGSVDTPWGTATVTTTEPKPLAIHRMAKAMWAPMLVMGAMAVAVGFIISLVWSGQASSGDSTTAAAAWTQGLQFLGEGLLLSGISFLLGTILASLRSGGGQVQESLGLSVTTLKMPVTAKIFVGLMMMGLMISMLQFVLYLVVAGGVDNPAAWFAWLGPLRELGLALLLSGIVMALVTIGNVLGFQFSRIREIIQTGR